MHKGKNVPLYLISVDMDGTVAAPNMKLTGIYEKFLRELQEVPEIEIVLNSGKSISYLETEAARIGAKYVIANNGAAMQILGGDQMIFGGNRKDIIKLRHLVALKADDEGVRPIPVGKDVFNVAVEEGKKDIVLTLFSEPEKVKHRYQFDQGINRMELYEHLKKLIKKNKLHLHVLHPHPDGAVDVVRLYNSKPIDKSTLPKMVRQVWSHDKVIQISMMGDGSNDVPAMVARGVIGVTFPEADSERVIKPVLEHGGIVTKRQAWGKDKAGEFIAEGGVVEGIQELARRGFFKHLSGKVEKICEKYLPEIDKVLKEKKQLKHTSLT
ncbi:MAG: HAD hydrolase family protein [Candidatus Pacebacteria bacterium]|nr:HAD hydrolase family protein [Candidatus Paceibacterota bacterium]